MRVDHKILISGDRKNYDNRRMSLNLKIAVSGGGKYMIILVGSQGCRVNLYDN